MESNDAIISMMCQLGSRGLIPLTRDHAALVRALQEYLDMDEPTACLDSEQAAELATINEDKIYAAAAIWAKLDERQRQVLVSLSDEADDLRYDLESAVSLPEPDDEWDTAEQEASASAETPHPRAPDWTCAACGAEDPGTALLALQRTRAAIVEESHFSINESACSSCHQPWITVFAELIDWDNGDDSQAWTTVPVSPGELTALREAGAEDAERVLHDLALARPHVCKVHSRGGTVSVRWSYGAVPLFPHD